MVYPSVNRRPRDRYKLEQLRKPKKVRPDDANTRRNRVAATTDWAHVSNFHFCVLRFFGERCVVHIDLGNVDCGQQAFSFFNKCDACGLRLRAVHPYAVRVRGRPFHTCQPDVTGLPMLSSTARLRLNAPVHDERGTSAGRVLKAPSTLRHGRAALAGVVHWKCPQQSECLPVFRRMAMGGRT